MFYIVVLVFAVQQSEISDVYTYIPSLLSLPPTSHQLMDMSLSKL